MLGIIFWVAVGLFLGWAFPKPEWVKNLQDKVVSTVKGWFGK